MFIPIIPVIFSRGYQKLSDAPCAYTTLREPLEKRFTCPIIVTTVYTDENNVEHKSKSVIPPINPSYNLEHLYKDWRKECL